MVFRKSSNFFLMHQVNTILESKKKGNYDMISKKKFTCCVFRSSFRQQSFRCLNTLKLVIIKNFNFFALFVFFLYYSAHLVDTQMLVYYQGGGRFLVKQAKHLPKSLKNSPKILLPAHQSWSKCTTLTICTCESISCLSKTLSYFGSYIIFGRSSLSNSNHKKREKFLLRRSYEIKTIQRHL